MKKYISKLLLVITILLVVPVYSQQKSQKTLVLVKKSNRTLIEFSENQKLTIIAKDTIYRNYSLVNYSDSTLTICKGSWSNSNELKVIRFNKIVAIKKPLIGKISGAEGLGFLSLGGAIMIAASPLIALGDNPNDGLEVLKYGSLLHFGCAIPIVLMNTKVKRKMSKWDIKTVKGC